MSVAGLAERGARLVALGVEAAPDADEPVVLELVADRRRIGVAGPHDRLGRQLHERVHDRGLEVRVARAAGGAHAADRALEERVAGEHLARRRAARPCRRCGPGVCSTLDLQAADLQRLAGNEVAGRLRDQVALGGMDEHLEVRPALEQRVERAARGRSGGGSAARAWASSPRARRPRSAAPPDRRRRRRTPSRRARRRGRCW